MRRPFAPLSGVAATLVLAALPLACGADETVSRAPSPHVQDAAADIIEGSEAGEDVDAAVSEAGNDASEAGADAADENPVDAPATSATLTIEQSLTIASVTSGHLAFPDLTRLSDGRLLLVYRRGASHVDKTGRIIKQFGSADGLTWSAPEVLYDEPNMDDRDPSVATLSNGELLVTYFQYQQLALPDGTLAEHHCFAMKSQDDGATFGPLVQIDPGEMAPAGATLNQDGDWVDGQGNPIIVQGCSSAVVEWQGRVVLPTYGGQSLNFDDMAGSPKARIYLYESMDWGASWTGGVIAADKATDHWLEEPALLVLDDGGVLLHMRTAKGASPSKPGKMMQMSWGGGAAEWSDVTPFPFVGHAPELAQLGSGLVLSGFRELNDAYTKEWVSFTYSLDRGGTWAAPVRVADCGASECGYPAIEELGADRFLFVYYGAGGKTIEAAIVRVDYE